MKQTSKNHVNPVNPVEKIRIQVLRYRQNFRKNS